MKQNRLYTLLQSHRKFGIALFWGFAIFFGCFGFPFANITNVLSNVQEKISMINIFTLLVAYAEVGLLSGYLFENKKVSIVLILNLTHIIVGMICRYFLEFGEVSNTYNFTISNTLLHIVTILCVCLCGYLHAKKQLEDNKGV